jgi:hypothetical protein
VERDFWKFGQRVMSSQTAALHLGQLLATSCYGAVVPKVETMGSGTSLGVPRGQAIFIIIIRHYLSQ